MEERTRKGSLFSFVLRLAGLAALVGEGCYPVTSVTCFSRQTGSQTSVLVAPAHGPQIFGDRVIPLLGAGQQQPFDTRNHRLM